MQERAVNIVDKIYARVMARVNESGVDYSSFTEENAILDFQDTFLSNFYPVSVKLNGKLYRTVEHAYQAAKFFSFDWNTLQQEVKDEINEVLKNRGNESQIIYNSDLFIYEKITAGDAKIIAEILRKYGCVDEGWEDKRVKIMIDLLLQKFKIPEILLKLEDTGEKELIEGNTWNDTLWGVSNGKGRNFLGTILMEIRRLYEKEKNVE